MPLVGDSQVEAPSRSGYLFLDIRYKVIREGKDEPLLTPSPTHLAYRRSYLQRTSFVRLGLGQGSSGTGAAVTRQHLLYHSHHGNLVLP
jgi:hypothetical protein